MPDSTYNYDEFSHYEYEGAPWVDHHDAGSLHINIYKDKSGDVKKNIKGIDMLRAWPDLKILFFLVKHNFLLFLNFMAIDQ